MIDALLMPNGVTLGEAGMYELTGYINNINAENTQVLMEFGSNGHFSNVYDYGVWRNSVDVKSARKTYYMYDGRGSVSGLTGQEGYDVVTYRYDIYGEETQSAATYNPYRYNAEYTDMATGLQYLRSRYYSPAITRFLSKDPVLGVTTLPYTFNPYLYCLNNAVNYIDPSGNFAILAAVGIGAAIGAVVSGGINVYEQYREHNNSFDDFSWGSLGKDALIGGVAGGVGGLAGGVFAGSAAAIVGGTAAMTTGQVITVGVVSSVAAGSVSRLTDATLDNAINGADRDPYGEVTDIRAVATDAVVGGVAAAIPRLTWGEKLTEKAKAISYKKYCGNGTPKIGKQGPSNPVDIPDEQVAQWQDDAKKAIDKADDAADALTATGKIWII
ncbi:MAG: RHS repeat-associated core domain-containing protein [Clostridia bacterium]